jgi:hypothetical protein
MVLLVTVSRGDLVPMLGVRAVQLSDRIVEAALEDVSAAKPIGNTHSYQVVRFRVVRAMDEPTGASPELRVIRLLAAEGVPQDSDALLTPARKGEPVLLLVRSVERVEVPAGVKEVKEFAGAYVIVTARAMSDVTPDDLTDLRQITEGVRQLDRDTRDEEIRDLAGALLLATEPTEIADVEGRLLAIGARCVPLLKQAISGSDSPNRARVQSIIDEIDVPEWKPSPLPK